MKKLSSYTNATADNLPAGYAFGTVTDESVPGAKDGSPVSAGLIVDVYYAIYAVLAEQGIVPNGTTEDTTGVSQFLASLKSLQKTTANPFMNYAHFRDEKANGVDGGSFVSGARRVRDLNVTSVNRISGASLSGNVITLPAGTYRVNGRCPANDVGDHQALLYDTTTGPTVLVYGSNANTTGNSDNQNDSFIKGEFTLSVESEIQVLHECLQTKNTDGFGSLCALSQPNTEVYSEIEFWKLD